MKKLTATLSLCALACLFASTPANCADTPSTSSADLAAKAQSLSDDAQTQLSAMKISKTSTSADSDHMMALQAQKTAADIAVKAHATASEWTNHADVIAQSAQKLNPTPSVDSSTTAATATAKTVTAKSATSDSFKAKK